MIILRALWALFLAGFVAYAFRRTWKWEHGSPMPETIWGSDKPRTKETAIWLDPSFLPVLLLIILLIFVTLLDFRVLLKYNSIWAWVFRELSVLLSEGTF